MIPALLCQFCLENCGFIFSIAFSFCGHLHVSFSVKRLSAYLDPEDGNVASCAEQEFLCFTLLVCSCRAFDL